MNKYTMIDFYVESRGSDVSDSTANLMLDVLPRIFDQMKQFGVELHDREIRGLNGEVLQRWLNWFRKNHKPATINNYICLLNPFLRWASTMTYGDGIPYIASDLSHVIHPVKMPSYDSIPEDERPKDKYYTLEQVEQLLAVPAVDSDLHKRDRAIVAMFLATGLRVSELCSLTIGSLLDREHGTLYVKRKGGAWKTTEVAEFAYEYVETYLATRNDTDDHSRPLFTTINGDPCNRKQIYKSLAKKQKNIDVATGPHALRHTFVSAAEKTGGGAVARDLANHKSIAITNRYDHSTAQQRKDAVNALPWAKRG